VRSRPIHCSPDCRHRLTTGAACARSTTTVFGEARSASINTISGTNSGQLNTVINSHNYVGTDTDGFITITGLAAGAQYEMKIITTDAASNVNNWAGISDVYIADTAANDAETKVGTFTAGTEPNSNDAQIASLSATADANGTIKIKLRCTYHHFGVPAIVLLQG
jgi:hypothetical protein